MKTIYLATMISCFVILCFSRPNLYAADPTDWSRDYDFGNDQEKDSCYCICPPHGNERAHYRYYPDQGIWIYVPDSSGTIGPPDRDK